MKKFTLFVLLTTCFATLALASNSSTNVKANYSLNKIGINSLINSNSKLQSNATLELLTLCLPFHVNEFYNPFTAKNVICDPPTPDVPTLPTINAQCSVTLTAPTATSDCYGPVTGTTTDPLNYDQEGTYFITWLYDDANGATSTQNQTVIINDTTAPVPNVMSLPTITAECSVTVIAPTATDNCTGTVTASTTSPFTYSDQGTYVITWNYNDGKGNTSSQTQTVIIDDTSAPVANVTNLPTISAQCSVTVGYPSATDNCDGTILATTPDSLTYNTEGTYVINWTYTDAEGNSSTQQQTVIINDNIAPVANVTSLPTITEECSATLDIPTATDNCAGTINGTTSSPLTYNTTGNYTVTWSYDDGNGNISSQTQSVIISVGGSTITYYQDLDVDGFGNELVSISSCSQPVGYVDNDGDCNDSELQYEDNDGDGFGSTVLAGCGVTNNTDCDDTNNLIFTTTLYYQDNDGDGFGNELESTEACTQPSGYVDNDGDCDDTSLQYEDNDGDGFGSTVFVGCGVENNIDCNDNDNQIGASTTYYEDLDGDGFGTGLSIIQACSQPNGYVTNDLDCDDNQILFADNDGDGAGSFTLAGCGVANSDDCNDDNPNIIGPITFYQDNDGDGFGDFSISIDTCFQPFGYVSNFNDCNDNEIQYQDLDEDGFGSTIIVGCGVTNSIDCDDAQILYQDIDGDGFGSSNTSNCGVTNNTDCDDFNPLYYNLAFYYQDLDNDGFGNINEPIISCFPTEGYVSNSQDCNDNLILYADNDEDSYGSDVMVACGGVTNSDDLDDNDPNSNNQNTYYQDLDGDGFGNPLVTIQGASQPIGYVSDNTDCNDNQIQYLDVDGDGFGSTTQVACGVSNNTDCDDNLLTYADADGDTYGSTTLEACGVTNQLDCNDNEIQYLDADNDGFGSTTQVACGVLNNTDCDDNLLTYADADGDTFGSTILVACGITNNSDCNDNEIQYLDADNDGFGSTTQVACGVSNNSDCDDNLLTYADVDGDGFGSTTLVACGITNNSDCNDNQIQYLDADGDTFGSNTMVACGVSNNYDCDDTNFAIKPIRLTKLNQAIYCNAITGASAYRFRVTNLSTNQVVTIDRTLRTFNLTQVSNSAFDRVFYVEACALVNGSYTNFIRIPACSIISPAPVTKLQNSQCGITITNLGVTLYANTVGSAPGYRFRVTESTNTNNVQTYDSPNRSFKMNLVPGVVFNKTYSVEVAVKNTDGTYLPYGPACNITTFSPTAKQGETTEVELVKEFTATAAPNPFAESFSLRVENNKEDKITYQVYDLMGRLVENGTLDSNELESVSLGANYPTGVYTMILSSADEVKNIRMVKR